MKFLKSRMVHQFTIFLLRSDFDERQKGFTLIELIIVMVILSILFAVAIPTFVSQIGKARESELLMKLGAIARSQQAYHFEKGEFATTMSVLKNNNGDISSYYYNFSEPEVTTTPTNTKVKHQAVAKNPGKDQIRDYAIGVYLENGAYNRATCQSVSIGEEVNVGNEPGDDCTNSGNKIQ
jgi:type IV pilus assembly protein PilA